MCVFDVPTSMKQVEAAMRAMVQRDQSKDELEARRARQRRAAERSEPRRRRQANAAGANVAAAAGVSSGALRLVPGRPPPIPMPLAARTVAASRLRPRKSVSV